MRVRYSALIGLPVCEQEYDEVIGLVSGILVSVDASRVLGFFVRTLSLFSGGHLFLSTSDIVHLGAKVRVRDVEALAPPEELIRLQERLDDPRTILGQSMVTDTGRQLGVCKDVQMDTAEFRIEWLFPRKWFREGTPIHQSSVLKVTDDDIVVRDPLIREPASTVETLLPVMEGLGTQALS